MNKYEEIKDVKARQIAFLDDTAAHYNLNNRSVDENVCLYTPKDQTKSDGCAIGRHLDEKTRKLLIDKDLNSSYVGKILEYLPLWMEEMGEKFLRGVQNLHDDTNNWTTTGLSDSGVSHVKTIKDHFNLNS
jgi:hypothetical protein